MDPRLLEHYNQELQHLREMGGEFAREFPKIAGRLGLDEFECTDPYVERLLEGFAFLAARVQLKLSAEFPRFTQHLLETVYPHYLAPLPSMAVAEFALDRTEGSLAQGFVVPRGSALRSRVGKGEQTPCEFRTAHDVTLWPLELTEAEYFTRDVAAVEIPQVRGVKAGIRLRLRTTAGVPFSALSLDRLPVYVRGDGPVAMALYEQLMANVIAVVARPAARPVPWQDVLDRNPVRPAGFSDEEALLPYGPRSFQGYRLLQEYFALPQRFLFAEFTGLGPSVRRCAGNELDLIVLLNRSNRLVENVLEAGDFGLFCTPAVNLFPKRADRIHLSEQFSEHHVVPDRTRPMDFEVYQVRGVTGHGTDGEDREFLPFYEADDAAGRREEQAYYTVHRLARVLSARQRQRGSRTSYVGSEVFLSLVDAREAPYSHTLRQLSVQTLCTNRDLPLQMPVGLSGTDFTLESGAPVQAIRCAAGPTRPKPSPAHASGEVSWRLIDHLSLNYLSLAKTDGGDSAGALREMLRLYGDLGETAVRKQIEGVRSVTSAPITRRVPIPGPIAFGRGLGITLTLDDAAFEGSGVFLLGSVLEQFFAKSVTVNSFTETAVHTLERGEVHRWPARIGRRPTL